MPAASGRLERMSRDPEDDDHTTFFRLEGTTDAGRDELVVSRARFSYTASVSSTACRTVGPASSLTST